MKSELLDPMNHISILGFLHAFKMDSDNNRAQEGATMCLIPFILKKVAAAARNARLSLKPKLSRGSGKECMLTSNIQVVNLLLETCATDDIIRTRYCNSMLHLAEKYVAITICWCPTDEDHALSTGIWRKCKLIKKRLCKAYRPW